MAFDLMMVKGEGESLSPATAVDAPAFARLPKGREVGVTIKELRNGRFHRKVFALLGLMYDYFPAVQAEYDHTGKPLETPLKRSFDGFREDALIKMGYYSMDVRPDGYIRFVADSLTYAKCPQEKIERIFDDLIELAVKTMAKYQGGDNPQEDLRDIIDELLEFGS